MKRGWVIAILFFSMKTMAQEVSRELPEAIKQIMETIVSVVGEEQEVDIQSLYDMYEALLEYPIDLNSATEEDLRQLQLLTDFQIQSLLTYRKTSGELFSIYEVPLVHGFNEEIFEQLQPFITVYPLSALQREHFSDRFTRGRHQFIGRTGRVIEEQRGYSFISPEDLARSPNSRYLGSPWYAYTRYRYTYKNKTQWGLTATNHAGEPFFSGINRAGFDFYSAHVQMKDIGVLKNFIVGDYHIQFGQGLVIWSGMSFGKTGDVLAVKKQERGFSGYTSTDENRFFRGVATTFNSKRFSVSTFASYKKVDAVRDSTGFTSLQLTGQHNTQSTAVGKNAVSETVFGGNCSYRLNNVKIGITGIVSAFGNEYHRAIRPYSIFELSQQENANLSMDFYGIWKRVSVFGEVAVSDNGGRAGLVGVLFDLDRSFCISSVYRNYMRNYQAYYAAGFGEGNKTNNEEGWYIGMRWMPHRRWTFSSYVDIFDFSWLRYQVDAPSSGWDYWAQLDFNTTKELSMYMRIRQKNKPRNASSDANPVKQLQDVNLLHLRYQINYVLLLGLSMTDRAEISFYQGQEGETGMLLYHDIKYKQLSLPVDFSLRFAVFNTDSWNTRIYAYENDVLYTMSIPAYSGQGARWYLNLHSSLWKRMDIWFRYAQSRYFYQATNGSGLNTIDGNTHTDIKLQVSVKF